MPEDSARSHRDAGHLVLVDEAGGLLLPQDLAGLRQRKSALLRAVPEEAREQVPEVHVHLLDALGAEDLERRHRPLRDVHLHRPGLEVAVAELGPQLLAGRGERARDFDRLARLRRAGRSRTRGGRRRSSRRSSARSSARAWTSACFSRRTMLHRRGDEVADDRLDVATDVAHLRELGGLHLDEGASGQLREAPGDLGLAHPGRPDHEDVLGRDLRRNLRRQALAPNPVPQRDRHRSLRRRLADHPAIQLGDDLPGRESVESTPLRGGGNAGGAHSGRVSTSIASLV